MNESTEINFLVKFRKAKRLSTLEIMAKAADRRATTLEQQQEIARAMDARKKEIDLLNAVDSFLKPGRA